MNDVIVSKEKDELASYFFLAQLGRDGSYKTGSTHAVPEALGFVTMKQ